MTARGGRERLPAVVTSFLDGTALADKIGRTILLNAAEDGEWPHLALLSVGEVVAVSDSEIRLALYATSRTTASLAASGRGLLTMVLPGGTYKVYVRADRVAVGDDTGDGPENAFFRCTVDRVERDTVSYARVRHGIEYELVGPEKVLERWERQVQVLTGAGWG